MSAFAVIYQFPGSESGPVGNSEICDKVMGRLSQRGSEGSNIVSAGHVTLGYWHFSTTPEEVGERQPLKLQDLPFRIVFDGRIDNREELFAQLGISSAEGKTLSDAGLALRAYARWGEDCFKYFVGEFALVIFAEQLNEIVAARDQLGDRTLFYALSGSQLVIASEPWAVAAASPSKPVINENTVAHYFAVRVPQDGQTFFKDVFELLPAHILKANAASHRLQHYWSPDPYRKIRYKNDEEYAEHFRSLLEQSIRSRMRSSLPVGILMSGGLDSTSVACLAARMIAPQPLSTISYVFDELRECDERQYIEAVKERYGIHSIQIPCDDVWAFKSWHYNPNQPSSNLYRMILERVYARAYEEGMHILLTGYMGDHLYSAGSDWLADLILDGQILRAGRELMFQIKEVGWKKTLETRHVRRIARRMMNSTQTGMTRLHRQHGMPEWIHPSFKNSFIDQDRLHPIFKRHGTLLSLEASNDLSRTFCNTNRYQIELRNPYRDRRLIEFVLALPAYQLYSHGKFKHILRTAMHGILPEIIRTRRGSTSFVSLYHRGTERERDVMESCINDPKTQWRRFLHPAWTSKLLHATHATGLEGLLPFLCVSYEVWHQSFALGN